MAEPKQADGKPTLVAVGGDTRGAGAPAGGSEGAPERTPEPARQGRGGIGIWLLALALAIALVAALVQSQRLQQASGRIANLEDRVVGLEAQLSAANTQIHTLEMQRGQVREAVEDLTERVLLLSELVAE